MNSNIAVLLGLLAFSAPSLQAAEQPKPGPEHKKMEMCVGEWTYEGSSEATPLGPADKFRGKQIARMILGGFVLETREEDKGDSGYIFEAVYLRGYDPVAKVYPVYGFENDGNALPSTTTVQGNTWTTTGTRKDSNGKAYKTRTVFTYSSDGKTSTFVTEYSPDEGKTWLLLWKGTMKRTK